MSGISSSATPTRTWRATLRPSTGASSRLRPVTSPISRTLISPLPTLGAGSRQRRRPRLWSSSSCGLGSRCRNWCRKDQELPTIQPSARNSSGLSREHVRLGCLLNELIRSHKHGLRDGQMECLLGLEVDHGELGGSFALEDFVPVVGGTLVPQVRRHTVGYEE